MYPKGQAPFWTPACYIDTWKPIFYTTKLLGYAPISRVGNGYQTTTSDQIFSFAALVLYATMFVISIYKYSGKFAWLAFSDSQILDIGLNVSVLLCNFTAVIVVIFNYINRYKICEISHAIQAIDDELITLGFEMKYRRDLVVHVMQIVISLVGQLCLYAISFWLRKAYEITNLTDFLMVLYVVVTVTYSVYMSNFIFVMVNIEKRYKAINQTLKTYFIKKPLAQRPGLGHVCTKLAKLHDYLGDNVDAVNETLAFHV